MNNTVIPESLQPNLNLTLNELAWNPVFSSEDLDFCPKTVATLATFWLDVSACFGVTSSIIFPTGLSNGTTSKQIETVNKRALKTFNHVAARGLWRSLSVWCRTCSRTKTVVRCAVSGTEEVQVEVGLNQGAALSPCLMAKADGQADRRG